MADCEWPTWAELADDPAAWGRLGGASMIPVALGFACSEAADELMAEIEAG